jgi:hypothetical protein
MWKSGKGDPVYTLNRLRQHTQAITDASEAIRLDPGLALGHNARE